MRTPGMVAIGAGLMTACFIFVFTAFLLIRSFHGRRRHAVTAALAACLSAVLAIEAAGRAYAHFRPAYEVLFLQPDPVIGWKAVPKLEFTWTGPFWCADEFSVPVTINSHGFRDLEREIAKPPGYDRIAVLGDSFVEALQVPLEKTAAQVLERRLNLPSSPTGSRASPWQVFNFGVSSHGLGQNLLMWRQYASHYQPHYVFVLLGYLHMGRTVTATEPGVLSETRLRVRPTFSLKDNKLITEPAGDYGKFMDLQLDFIRTGFQGGRIRQRSPNSFAREILSVPAYRFRKALKLVPSEAADYPESNDTIVGLNLRILQELSADTARVGAQLIVVDICEFLAGSARVSRQIQACCVEHNIGYLCLSERLADAGEKGIQTRWRCDRHFNEAGNSLFGNAMYDWLAEHHFSVSSQVTSDTGETRQ